MRAPPEFCPPAASTLPLSRRAASGCQRPVASVGSTGVYTASSRSNASGDAGDGTYCFLSGVGDVHLVDAECKDLEDMDGSDYHDWATSWDPGNQTYGYGKTQGPVVYVNGKDVALHEYETESGETKTPPRVIG